MAKTDKKQNERCRVMFYLDRDTLKRLDKVAERMPDIASRSAAVRHLARIDAEQQAKLSRNSEDGC